MDYAEQKGLGVILGADTNSHSTSYGTTNNSRGDLMDLFITRYKLDIENKGTIPTYESRGAKTYIDATLTARLSVSVNNWMVSQEYNGSDHNTITFETYKEYEEIPQKWNWKEAN